MEMTAGYKSIDMDTWSRREYYDHYAHGTKCMCAITADIDVTSLYNTAEKTKKDFFIAMLYAITATLNKHEEFRVGYCRENGRLMIWDKIVPAHSVFHKETETFTRIWSDWYLDFEEFYKHCAADIEKGKTAKGFSIPDVPDNTFDVTYIPSLYFSSIDLKLSESGKYLSPIVTMGKPVRSDGKIIMPISMEISHAVADTFHISRFFAETESTIAAIAEKM